MIKYFFSKIYIYILIMPVNSNSLSLTTDNNTTNTTSQNLVTGNLVYFIVSLVIQTEYSSNGNQNLTQKQITELFNIGCTIKQLYDLTVTAGFADADTFLSSIPVAYEPLPNKSIFDEILECSIPNVNTYVQLIQKVNVPGPKCWAFGSVDIVLASIASANKVVTTFALKSIDTSDSSGITGNSIHSLWKVFNSDNDLPANYVSADNKDKVSNVTLVNVAKSVQNYIKLHKFCTGATDNGITSTWGSGPEMRTYANLVTNAKIPVEVLLCARPTTVIQSNIITCLSMNNVWNFLTNESKGTATTDRTSVNTSNVLKDSLDFKTALSWLNSMGFTITKILNNDTLKIIDATWSNAVSEVLKQIANKPSLYTTFAEIFSSTYTTIAGDEYYVLQLVNRYNDAVTVCANMGANMRNFAGIAIEKVTNNNNSTFVALTEASFPTINNTGISYTLPAGTSVKAYGIEPPNSGNNNTTIDADNDTKLVNAVTMFGARPSVSQYVAYNNLARIVALIGKVYTNVTTGAPTSDEAKFLFRVSLNGFYPVTQLTLATMAPFIIDSDKYTMILNFSSDSANLEAFSTVPSCDITLMSQNSLYLFNKFMAIGKSGIVIAPFNALTNKKKFDFATLLALGETDQLIGGDGLNAETAKNVADKVYNDLVANRAALITAGNTDLSAVVVAADQNVANALLNKVQLTPLVGLKGVMIRAIASAYQNDTSSSTNPLAIKVNNLDDYGLDGVIGNLNTTSNGIQFVDAIVFATPVQKVSRMLASTANPGITDYNLMSSIIGKVIKYGQTLDWIHSVKDETVFKENVGGNVLTALAAYAILATTDVKFALFITWLNGTTPSANEKSTIISKILSIANELNINLGIKLVGAGTAVGTTDTVITNISNIVNSWVDNAVNISTSGIPTIESSTTLTTIVNAFFGMSGLTMSTSDIQQQIIIKKLAGFYNNASFELITLVAASNMPLGLWAQYVPLRRLCFTDATNTVKNFDVDEILNVAQQLSIYDYSSGKSTGIVNVELITAEDLVNASIIKVNELPSYIAYTELNISSGNYVTSQDQNLKLIIAVCKAMDQASGSRTYTEYLWNAFYNATLTGTGKGGITMSATIISQLFANVTQLDPDFLNHYADGANDITIGTQSFDASKLITQNGLTTLAHSDVLKVLNYVLSQFNADGTPNNKNVLNQYNPYY